MKKLLFLLTPALLLVGAVLAGSAEDQKTGMPQRKRPSRRAKSPPSKPVSTR